MCDLVEQRLRNSVEGTAFRPGVCESYPGVMASSAVAQGVLDCFQDMDLSEDDVSQWRTAFSGPHLDSALAKIQVYWVDATIRGRNTTECGPEWMGQKRRAELGASSSMVWAR